MGLYDLPALIDRVLEESKSDQLFYVGHSMGTTIYYVLCSLKPEYNDVLRTAVHLAPISFGIQKDMTMTLQLLLQNVEAVADTLKKQHVYQFLPRTARNQVLVDYVCADSNRQLCIFFVDQLYGQSSFKNVKKLRSYLKKLVSGTSVKTMLHLAQIFKTKNFAMFDYGKEMNNEKYMQNSPPSYPLSNVTSPVALFYGGNDVFTDDYSIFQLKQHLPNVVASVSIPNYNHIDLLFAESSPKILYKKIAKLFNKS